MRRRALLSLLGTASIGSLAGCSTGFSQRITPEVASTNIEAQDRECSDSPDESALITSKSDDGTQFEVTGSIAVPRIDEELYVDAQNGQGKPERSNADMEVRIDFGPPDSQANTDVPECEGQIAYNAEVEFTRQPTEVIVRHTVEEDDSYTLKTITTKTINQ